MINDRGMHMQNKPETDKQQGKYIWKFASAGKDNEIPAFFSITWNFSAGGGYPSAKRDRY